MTHPKTLVSLIMCLGLLAAACAPEEAVVEVPDVDTSMVGGYLSAPSRSGVASGAIGDRPVVAYRIDGDQPVIASPALAFGIAYVTDGSGELVAFDVSSGEVRWRSTIGEADASVVASADSVFSVSNRGVVRRHDRASGEIAWESDLEGFSRSSPMLFDGALWVAVDDQLAVLDPASGVTRHSVELEAPADSSPAASGDVIVIGTRSNTLAFIDRTTLDVENVALPEASQELRTYADGVAATPVISDGSVYVGSTTGSLLSASLSGDVRWTLDLESPIYGAVAVGDGTGFVPTASGRLVAFGLDDGLVRWSADLGDAAYSSPVLVGDTVLATAENGRLYAFGSSAGELLWSLEVGESGNYMASTPAVSGTLVVLGSNDGSIVGVDTAR